MDVLFKTQHQQRSLRKAYYSSNKLPQTTLITLREAIGSSQTYEVNQKYRRFNVPKVEIESVVRNSHSQSKTLKHLSNVISHGNDSTPRDRAFYYTETNEVLSVQEFLNFYKSTEIQRAYFEKQKLRNRIEQKRMKVEQFQNSPGSTSAMSPTKASSPNNMYSPSKKNSKNEILNDITGSQRRDSAEFSNKVIIENLRTSHNVTANEDKDNIYEPRRWHTENPMTQRSMGNWGIPKIQSAKKSYFTINTEPKLTEKAIHKHLLHLTVSPKKLKVTDSLSRKSKESMIQTLFKDPKVWDQRLEVSMRNDSKDISPNAHKNFAILNSLTTVNTQGTDDSGERTKHLTTKRDDERTTHNISSKIERNIEEINTFLKSSVSRPNTSKSTGKLNSERIIKRGFSMSNVVSPTAMKTTDVFGNYVPRRVPLRAEIEKKYKIYEKIKNNKNFANEIKVRTNEMKKKVSNDVAFKNREYLEYFI